MPPLEVEVVAGESHLIPRPQNNAVHVELQPSAPPEAEASVAAHGTDASGSITEAADRVQMSADANTVVSHSVKPGYPVLARQMKVQGSVILRALISKDGFRTSASSAALRFLPMPHGKPSNNGTSSRTSKVRTRWKRKPKSPSTSQSPLTNYK